MDKLFELHEAGDIVAFGDAGERTLADLCHDVAVLRDALPPLAAGAHISLVFRSDRYMFAAALLASWSAGFAVALPPNTRRDAILGMAEHPSTAATMHDLDSSYSLRVPELLASGGSTAEAFDLRANLSLPSLLATLYTSGSTGDSMPCPKTPAQLIGEAKTLVAGLNLPPKPRVLATVPPGHIYGLLFSVLVPLLSGGSFSRETPLHAASVARIAREGGASVLVTVPAHLRQFGILSRGELGYIEVVTSSTAPLNEDTFNAFHDAHGIPVREMFGSSETGGIATRLRPLESTWNPLPGLKVSTSDEGRLVVDSPFLSNQPPAGFETEDLVRIHDDGSFSHRGRVGRVVKIGGRRVSLAELEAWLIRHDAVSDAAVRALPIDGVRGFELLAAIAPAEPGRTLDTDAISKEMAQSFEPSTLPRRWATPSELPREHNGKLRLDGFYRLFGLNSDGTARNYSIQRQPVSTERIEDETTHQMTAYVPTDSAFFDGHFRGYPVMAAAVQLRQLIRPLTDEVFGPTRGIRELRKTKFTGRIQPGDTVHISLTIGNDPDSAAFRIRRGDVVCSAGVLKLDAVT